MIFDLVLFIILIILIIVIFLVLISFFRKHKLSIIRSSSNGNSNGDSNNGRSIKKPIYELPPAKHKKLNINTVSGKTLDEIIRI